MPPLLHKEEQSALSPLLMKEGPGEVSSYNGAIIKSVPHSRFREEKVYPIQANFRCDSSAIGAYIV